ncbi:MAG: AAA family ATPase [Treponemataceae bacterium]|nr:AAA family ATPase [Treponemataceae bacterium]
MEKLIETFRKKINSIEMAFIRSLESKINWNARLICIRGSRGTGKTTLLLQHIKKTFVENLDKVIYVSLDNLYFSDNSLIDFVDRFVKHGGTHLFFDEVHKYPDWSRVIKNIYDDYPELHVVFTGSSLLEIVNARSDLSRRALVYNLQGLSFREYLNLCAKTDFPILTLEGIISENEKLSSDIATKIKPFEYFDDYLKFGYYPYFLEGIDDYYTRLNETVNLILEIELPLLRKIDVSYITKIKKLLALIGKSAPFIPNVTELASTVQIARQTLLQYFQYLEESKLIYQVFKQSRGLGVFEKPDKIFLENTNLMFMLSNTETNVGNIRETFAFNQLSHSHEVFFSEQSDFFVDKKFTFEIGGKNKKRKQISNIPDSYILADNIEFGTERRIPIWLLGFLY